MNSLGKPGGAGRPPEEAQATTASASSHSEWPEWRVALPAQSEFHLQSAKCTDFVARDTFVRVDETYEGVTE